MLAAIAGVLLVLWLLGFIAFSCDFRRDTPAARNRSRIVRSAFPHRTKSHRLAIADDWPFGVLPGLANRGRDDGFCCRVRRAICFCHGVFRFIPVCERTGEPNGATREIRFLGSPIHHCRFGRLQIPGVLRSSRPSERHWSWTQPSECPLRERGVPGRR
jgi:hypothetical protein